MFSFEIPSEQTEGLETLKGETRFTPPISVEELSALCEGNPLLQEVLKDMVLQCIKYAHTVAEFKKIILTTKEEGMGEALSRIDAIRSTTHDATIDSINVFSRTLAKEGKDNKWMSLVTDNRATYGKFALQIALSTV